MAENPDVTLGTMAPEFSLPGSNGSEIKLADFRSKNNIVLFFIREFN
jgi:peroxiredoxin